MVGAACLQEVAEAACLHPDEREPGERVLRRHRRRCHRHRFLLPDGAIACHWREEGGAAFLHPGERAPGVLVLLPRRRHHRRHRRAASSDSGPFLPHAGRDEWEREVRHRRCRHHPRHHYRRRRHHRPPIHRHRCHRPGKVVGVAFLQRDAAAFLPRAVPGEWGRRPRRRHHRCRPRHRYRHHRRRCHRRRFLGARTGAVFPFPCLPACGGPCHPRASAYSPPPPPPNRPRRHRRDRRPRIGA
mmetsp:Transcript_1491/g.3109  ORF Transcript_1491/g.3109 Transcript_1491/m.3109 type:complete len:243 (+) Transcript_1491:2325-3053(+)